MKDANAWLTDEEVEQEIERLNAFKAVALARREQRLKYKRRQYLYQLRDLKKEVLDALYKTCDNEE